MKLSVSQDSWCGQGKVWITGIGECCTLSNMTFFLSLLVIIIYVHLSTIVCATNLTTSTFKPELAFVPFIILSILVSLDMVTYPHVSEATIKNKSYLSYCFKV